MKFSGKMRFMTMFTLSLEDIFFEKLQGERRGRGKVEGGQG